MFLFGLWERLINLTYLILSGQCYFATVTVLRFKFYHQSRFQKDYRNEYLRLLLLSCSCMEVSLGSAATFVEAGVKGTNRGSCFKAKALRKLIGSAYSRKLTASKDITALTSNHDFGVLHFATKVALRLI